MSTAPVIRLHLYFALDGRWSSEAKGSYTAISQPPWFTALALYPQGDTWGGGGTFVGNDLFLIHTHEANRDIIGRAKNLERVFQITPTREIATGIVRADGSRAPLSRDLRMRILEGETAPMPLDHYDTLGGCLYRRKGMELELIRDFTNMVFEPIRAPYDQSDDPDNEAQAAPLWHPLDEDNA